MIAIKLALQLFPPNTSLLTRIETVIENLLKDLSLVWSSIFKLKALLKILENSSIFPGIQKRVGYLIKVLREISFEIEPN